jgi:hypothetical protein
LNYNHGQLPVIFDAEAVQKIWNHPSQVVLKNTDWNTMRTKTNVLEKALSMVNCGTFITKLKEEMEQRKPNCGRVVADVTVRVIEDLLSGCHYAIVPGPSHPAISTSSKAF